MEEKLGPWMDVRRCLLCKVLGENEFVGRLLPLEGAWLHTNCAMWSSEVRLGVRESEGWLLHVCEAIKRAPHLPCTGCNVSRPSPDAEVYPLEVSVRLVLAGQGWDYGMLREVRRELPLHVCGGQGCQVRGYRLRRQEGLLPVRIPETHRELSSKHLGGLMTCVQPPQVTCERAQQAGQRRDHRGGLQVV
jgi:hypothetical protein